ncbi:MAG: retroviral-like aspartic protease family protein [Caldilineales bacterium]|nr:retroviral-like aspartic protease family protein [Caldilineales bacterium]MDW8317844.1 retropepsin-like aspartic protease [Anaerolineae bacterium]
MEYDLSVFPPAPKLAIRLHAQPDGTSYGPVTAFVDTGADATVVPLKIVRELRAGTVSLKTVRGYTGGRRAVRTYLVDVEVGPYLLPGIEILGDAAAEEILLGRDVLNKLRLLLDGPARQTQVLE